MSEATDLARIAAVRAKNFIFGIPDAYEGVRVAKRDAAATGALTNTALPTISGTKTEGQTLTATTGTWARWSETAAPTFTYQWIRCDADGLNPEDIAAATAATYVLVTADATNTIRVAVTATHAEETETATSAQTTAITGL